ncbi:hypothetical protein NM688_g1883 [Phlebia brevispora]|uniref:Uncharacterized protein n=1 Tax=Phlebia brevispora TaxID=194682 RepID=A0ACC1TAG6_9APHY|nr:hypothetical protein NM688_g1883 [Phlebia brevispora]
MRSKQRVEIKKVINELGRRAVELQAYRGSLIQQIRSDPNYKHEAVSALIASHNHLSKDVHPKKQPHQLHPVTLEMIQKVLLAEASITRIRDKSAELSSLIAPIHVLPDELLRLIFTHVACQPTPEDNVLAHMSFANRKDAPAPIVLASVSRRWRNLVISSPTLWTRIYLSPWQPRYWSQLAIARSGSAPLDITLDCCIDSTPYPEVLDQLLDVVLPEVERWEGIGVVAHHCFSLAYVGRLFSDLHAPILRRLRLSLTGKGPPGDQSVVVPNLFRRGAPRLSHVYLYSVGLPWDSSTLLCGLTCLDLRWMWNETKLTYDQFRSILAACPDLKQLVLRGQYVDLQAAIHTEPLCVPSLRYLEISGNNVSRMCSILVAPGLHTLYLANVDEAEFRELMQLFQGFPQRIKHPALRSLRLFNVRTTQPSAGFLEAISTVEEFTIIHSDAARFLPLLRGQQGSGETGPSVILPKLKTLTLLDDASDETLLTVVAERAALGYPLQRVNVHAGSVNGHYRDYLQQLVRLDGIYFQDHNH